jgi:hypothetical protein
MDVCSTDMATKIKKPRNPYIGAARAKKAVYMRDRRERRLADKRANELRYF